MLEHHLVEGVNGKISLRVSVLQSGHWSVQGVCLMAEGWVLHCDDFECVLVMEEIQSARSYFSGKNV